jgi:integrase
MARPRTTNKHLPKYVSIIHGAYWYRAPKQKAVRICPVDDEVGLYKWMADKLTPAGPITTMNDVFDRYERDVLPTLQPRTQVDYRRHLLRLRKVFGQMGPDEVEPRHIGQFLDVDRGKIQRNRMVALLSAVYSKAVGRWYVAKRNPCRDVERNPSRKRDRYVTDAEYQAFRDHQNPRVQVAMDLALLTGQRQGDLLRLKWAQVTEVGVYFQQGKTGKKLLVEMSPALEAVLSRAKGFLPHLPREYVLRKANGQPYAENGFRAIWQHGMKVAVKGTKRKAPYLAERFTFHDLRAKSVSDSDTIEHAFERAGHTSMAMTRGVYDRGVRKVKPLK